MSARLERILDIICQKLKLQLCSRCGDETVHACVQCQKHICANTCAMRTQDKYTCFACLK
jgi:hypothetical protein